MRNPIQSAASESSMATMRKLSTVAEEMLKTMSEIRSSYTVVCSCLEQIISTGELTGQCQLISYDALDIRYSYKSITKQSVVLHVQ